MLDIQTIKTRWIKALIQIQKLVQGFTLLLAVLMVLFHVNEVLAKSRI